MEDPGEDGKALPTVGWKGFESLQNYKEQSLCPLHLCEKDNFICEATETLEWVLQVAAQLTVSDLRREVRGIEFFFFLVALQGLWDLSSPIRD